MLLNPTPDQLLFQQTTATFLDELVPPGVLRELRDDPTGEPDGYWARSALSSDGSARWCGRRTVAARSANTVSSTSR